jgi:hypothetical protein
MKRVHASLQSVLLCVTGAAILTLLSAPAQGQLVLKNEDVAFKFGVQGQLWADWTQDSSGSQAYQQNFYLRRARLIFGGDIGENISFFFETDDPKLGIVPKSLASGFVIQDALMEWRPSKVFQVVGGLMIVPFSRNGLQSTLSYMTLDLSPISTVTNSVTQSSALRDVGLEAKGFFFKDHLLYRIGEFSGERDANGHNSPRTAGYLQYDFFAREKSYLFAGTALGKQKILAVDGGFDTQGTYRGLSANMAAALPVHQGDEVAAQFQYIHYNGGTKFLTIADQNDCLLEGAYYSHRAKIQPFVKYDAQNFVNLADTGKDIHRAGFGANYYIRGQNLKWTLQYLRAMPQNGSPLKATNEVTMQLQLAYY